MNKLIVAPNGSVGIIPRGWHTTITLFPDEVSAIIAATQKQKSEQAQLADLPANKPVGLATPERTREIAEALDKWATSNIMSDVSSLRLDMLARMIRESRK